MSDEQVSVEDQARALGWVPQEEFRGDPEKWADAETFVEKGRHIMPLLQKNNDRLQGQLAQLQERQRATEAALAQAQAALADMEEQHTVQTQKAVDAARKELKAQIAQASENGDHVALAELTDQLAQMPVEVEKPVKTIPAAQPLPPDFVSWQNDNPWFGVDMRKTALANAVGQELRNSGSTLVGRPFWDAVSKEVESVFGAKNEEPVSDKVEGSRGSGRGASTGRTYADLPSEAKAACDADLRSKVGDGKRYKTAAEWRNRYAEIYFGTEN